jgi:hypothetical protein
MNIFRKDPTASLKKEHEIRKTLAGQLADLNSKRPELLLSDDPAIIDRHDAEVARLERADRIHLERIAVLELSQDDLRRQTLERRKTEALAAFEAKLAMRAAAAVRVENAIAEFSASLAAYEASVASPFFEWPAGLFPPLRQFWEFSKSNLVARIGSPEVLDIRSAAPIRLRELAQRLGPIADRDEAFAATLVESIRSAPLPGRANDDEIAA